MSGTLLEDLWRTIRDSVSRLMLYHMKILTLDADLMMVTLPEIY